jgi:hypothetical protein
VHGNGGNTAGMGNGNEFHGITAGTVLICTVIPREQEQRSRLVIAIPDHFRNPGISGLKTRNPGIGISNNVGKLAVSKIVGKAYYRPTDSKGLISV